MQTIYLDISNKGVVPTIYAKQGDVGRKFEVIFTNSGLPYVPPDGSVFSVWYSGSSGEGNYTDIDDRSAFSVNENKVAVEMISQMLTNDGNGVMCLVLNESNGNQIGSWNIPYICEKIPGFDSEGAKEYYTAFSESVEKLKQVTENLTPEAIGAAPAVESADHPGCYYRTVNGMVEWVNPPMTLGEEYRTTERWNGKPVYTMMANIGALPNNTGKTTDGGPLPIGITPISAYGIALNGQTGAVIPSRHIYLSVYGEWGTVYINTDSDYSNYTGYIIVKYVRD